MKKLIEMKTVEFDGHHMFTYKDGKKTPIPSESLLGMAVIFPLSSG